MVQREATLRELLEDATPGLWTVRPTGHSSGAVEIVNNEGFLVAELDGSLPFGDAELICALHNYMLLDGPESMLNALVWLPETRVATR